ncbi:MAG: hypothetical protein ABF876_05105 [Acetobacter aceti]
MADSILVGSKQTFTPGAFSTTNDTAMNPVSAGTGNTLVLMGTSTGGKPNTLLGPYADPTAAAKELIGGELLTAVQKSFSASTAVNAPSTIYAVNVGSAPAATLSLKDSSGADAIDLTTVQYGTAANTAMVAVYAASVSGTEISVKNAGGTAITKDNIERDSFTLAYTGSAASADITVASEEVTLCAPTGTAVATLDLNQYQTVAQLVDAINTVSGFEATIVPTALNDTALNALDPCTSKALTTTAITITANLQAQIDFFNSNVGGGIFTATRAATATGPADPVGWETVTPVTVPAPLVTDWTDAFSMLEGYWVDHISVVSPNSAVWAAADAHAQYMTKTAQMPRRIYTGPAAGMSRDQVAPLGAALNSDRIALIWPGIYMYDANGNKTLYPPYIAASLVAAGFAGLSPGQSMTNVSLDVLGLEVQVGIPTDTDVLIPAGIMPLATDRNGVTKVIRAVTTWLTDNKFDKVEVSTSIATDFVNMTVLDAVRSRLGTAGAQGMGVSPQTLAGALSDSETALNYCAKPYPQGPGVIVGDSSNPAWNDLTGTADGDTITVNFECHPVIPLNFIPVNNSIVPYSGTVSVNVSSTGSASASSS